MVLCSDSISKVYFPSIYTLRVSLCLLESEPDFKAYSGVGRHGHSFSRFLPTFKLIHSTVLFYGLFWVEKPGKEVCVWVCVCARAHVCVLVALSRPTPCNPWTVACQALLSMEFSRQEHGLDSHSLLQGISPTQGSG